MNRGEEKVRVHMNVVPRSTMNTNGGTITLHIIILHADVVLTFLILFPILTERSSTPRLLRAH